MTTIDSSSHLILLREAPFTLGKDQLAAVAFLARYSGRTLEAYRHDLRALFQWAADHDLPVLEATRTHLELLPDLDGGTGPGGVDHRPAPVHRLRILPLRPHRWADLLEPGPVRAPPHRATVGGAGPRPRRAGPAPVDRRALRSRPRCPGRPGRA